MVCPLRRFDIKRINHQEGYSLRGACTNAAESFFYMSDLCMLLWCLDTDEVALFSFASRNTMPAFSKVPHS